MRLNRPRSTLAVLLAAAALTTAAAPVPRPRAEVVEPFAQRYDKALYGDFRTLGNTVLGCPTDPADEAEDCADITSAERPGANNTVRTRRLNTTGTDPAFGSSTGRTVLPPGAKVAYARLFWGGTTGENLDFRGTLKPGCDDHPGAEQVGLSPGAPLDAVPRIRAGGTGAFVPVRPEFRATDPQTAKGAHFYTADADVTSVFAGLTGDGKPLPVAVDGIWAAEGLGCAAGWSLTIVHSYDRPHPEHAPNLRHVHVYGGHVLQGATAPDTTVSVSGFRRLGGAKARASVTAYEGDRSFVGDRFLVGGKEIAETSTGTTDNFFISRADGALDPAYVNNLSLDAKEFDLPEGAIAPGATATELTFRTAGDAYVPSALALSVPVPDLEVTKTASRKTVHPGEKVTYTIRAKNGTAFDHPDADFTDDLTDTLDDAVYLGDARATHGTVTYEAPKLRFRGDVPAGATAQITYSVRIKDPVAGDRRMRNGVEVDEPGTNCPPGSKDPACVVTPTVGPVKPTGRPTGHGRKPGGSWWHGGGTKPGGRPHPGPMPSAQTTGTRELARTGPDDRALWVAAGGALALAGLGVLASVSVRSRRRP
ncbi:hypothetical protein GCM10010329_16320 [Streptomyces spiroverticillatus]|uniref:DUF7927 domain-containing protein n=1 Tax=Streptomyces finlayi TaxID=67296 RepID=A0A918WTI8_9ACTN|nr:DUF11 domain-containing protein [Streptomyces finlayi]GGZ95914.1 hypothetical protein GCM10010329_16320 [Streptomyces spiroverticillatus]GHC81486.1 hypothetical protein GCM10010334_08810 [Streptomyces finlayi]